MTGFSDRDGFFHQPLMGDVHAIEKPDAQHKIGFLQATFRIQITYFHLQ
jgi:hypothetical protein